MNISVTQRITLIALIASLSSCSMSGKYIQPETGVPSSFRGEQSAQQHPLHSSSTIGRLSYRTFFQDPALLVLIESAIAHNSDLQLAMKNIDYASLTLRQAGLSGLPGFGLQGSASSSGTSDYGSNPLSDGEESVETFSASAYASWELDIWGKIRSRKKSALAGYLESVEAGKAVQTRLVASVAEGYSTLQMLDTQYAVTAQNLELAATTLSMMRLQYDAGLVTSLAVDRQEALKLDAEAGLAKIEQQIALQENALSVLCGRMPEGIERGAVRPMQNRFSAGIPAALLSNRPDVKAAELALMKAHAETGVAAANLYPSLTISAEAGSEALKASDWFTFPGSLFSFVQGAVLQPIFQQGTLRTAYKQSQVVREEEEIRFRQAVLDAVREVSDALVTIDKLDVQQRAAEKQVALLQQSVTNAGLLFQGGMADYLDVISAQSAALDAELSLSDIRRQQRNAVTELYRAAGGGWQ